jgi:hypothetical protein
MMNRKNYGMNACGRMLATIALCAVQLGIGRAALSPVTVASTVTTNLGSYTYSFNAANNSANNYGKVAEFFIPLFDENVITSITAPANWTGVVTTSSNGVYGGWFFSTGLPTGNSGNADYVDLSSYLVTNLFNAPPYFLYFSTSDPDAFGIANSDGLNFSFTSPYGPTPAPYDFIYAKFSGNGNLLSSNFFIVDPFIPLSPSLTRTVIPEPCTALGLLAMVGTSLTQRRRRR